MSDEIDLDKPPADESASARRRRRSRQRTESEKSKPDIPDNEIRSRTDRVLDRIAVMLRERDDEELAHIIDEDGDAMAQGFVSLTSNVKFLRLPLLMLLNLIEPALAFFRVGRVLFFRAVERQRRRMAQHTVLPDDIPPEYAPGQPIPDAEVVQ